MATEEQIEKLVNKLRQAENERDAWKGRSASNYEMACHMVKALEKQLRELGEVPSDL